MRNWAHLILPIFRIKTLRLIPPMMVFVSTTACDISGAAEDIFLICYNSEREVGGPSMRPRFYDGEGEVLIVVEPSYGEQGTATYNTNTFFTGDLSLDEDIFLRKDISVDGQYPKVMQTLRINRYSGEGYYQRSTYRDADTRPNYETHQLRNCRQTGKRF
tara:strand:- start:15950 stop:16429 length:480 start_codon:yes stop_codon:yes gene_type:complete